MEREVDKYIVHSFKKDFAINCRTSELFEPTKILGDTFEAVMGAVFLDGGIEECLNVY